MKSLPGLFLAALFGCVGCVAVGCSTAKVEQPQGRAVNGSSKPSPEDRADKEVRFWRMIRDIVSKGGLITYGREIGAGPPVREVVVPAGLPELYETQPDETTEALVAIAKYGPPSDALKALVYAEALLWGPGGPVATMASHASYPPYIDVPGEGFCERETIRESHVRKILEKVRK